MPLTRTPLCLVWVLRVLVKRILAMAKAVQALHAKQVSRIILTRPAVEAGEKLGFLPGTLNEKIDPYLRRCMMPCGTWWSRR